MASNTLWDLLLSPLGVLITLIILAAAVVLLIVKGRQMPAVLKAIAWIAAILCVIFFALIMWISAGFGSGPDRSPEPVPAPYITEDQ